MRDGAGGTRMWCPSCGEITVCAAIPGAQVTDYTGDYTQRFYHISHPDINWFQRGRKCLTCENKFLTGEMDLKYLWELVKLRDALSDIKVNAESYVQESAQASASLNKLADSLKVLRALNIYKETK